MQIDDLRDHVAAWTGNVCQIYEISVSEFHDHINAQEPIVREWRRDAVVVFGVPLAKIR